MQRPRRDRATRRDHRSKMSVMDVFRQSYIEKDKKKDAKQRQGELVDTSPRAMARRFGIDDDTLRSQIRAHLLTLMNTVALESTEDLSDTPLVEKSIVNFGFRDLSALGPVEIADEQVERDIVRALTAYEPRFVTDTVKVKMLVDTGDEAQRVSMQVSGEITSDPADLPISIEADIDLGSGKVAIRKLD